MKCSRGAEEISGWTNPWWKWKQDIKHYLIKVLFWGVCSICLLQWAEWLLTKRPSIPLLSMLPWNCNGQLGKQNCERNHTPFLIWGTCRSVSILLFVMPCGFHGDMKEPQNGDTLGVWVEARQMVAYFTSEVIGIWNKHFQATEMKRLVFMATSINHSK